MIRYKQWPSSLTGVSSLQNVFLVLKSDPQYLRPTYPGQLHTVRKNTWNVIVVLDFSLSSTLETVTQQISHMVQRGIPIRFGVIPMFDVGTNDICESMVMAGDLMGSYANGQAILV
jgi:UDP-glucose:glycoprotein glucosyltransferase